jgi:hypothetical protein
MTYACGFLFLRSKLFEARKEGHEKHVLGSYRKHLMNKERHESRTFQRKEGRG